jgi:uncharacterized Zn-finger protein
LADIGLIGGYGGGRSYHRFTFSLQQSIGLESIMSEANQTSAAVELGAQDLPAHCPNAAMPLWSSHPRVYLELDHHGEAKCPYCGTLYRLKPGTVVKGH